mgnify:FL=1
MAWSPSRLPTFHFSRIVHRAADTALFPSLRLECDVLRSRAVAHAFALVRFQSGFHDGGRVSDNCDTWPIQLSYWLLTHTMRVTSRIGGVAGLRCIAVKGDLHWFVILLCIVELRTSAMWVRGTSCSSLRFVSVYLLNAGLVTDCLGLPSVTPESTLARFSAVDCLH